MNLNKNKIAFLDFFLPRFCLGCGNKLDKNAITICDRCHLSLKRVSVSKLIHEYGRKFEEKKLVADFISLYEFEKDKPIQNILHAFKYQNKFLAGKYFGALLYSSYKEKIDSWNIDFLIAVPLHHLKKAERGYNQSDYIVKGIAAQSGIRIRNIHLHRLRYTESQTKKSIAERLANMADAFSTKWGKQIQNKKILLVDDVITTGATISECANVLHREGAAKIYAASIAIA